MKRGDSMKLIINKNYILFCFIAVVLLIDSAFLLVIKENKIMFSIYIIINLLFMIPILVKQKAEICVIISIFMMLFYTFFIDAYIHYFKQSVMFEAEFLFLIPLIIGMMKIRNKESKLFALISFVYLVFNLIILITERKVAFINYMYFLINIISFIGLYYVFSNIEITEKFVDLMHFIFYISFLLTIFQTAVGFNTDTRNGIFSVFGWGAYTFFIMMYFLYNYNGFLNKKITISKFIINTILCLILYICTESKAAIIMLVVNIAMISLIRRGFSFKKIVIIIVAICMIPLVYSLLIKFNPKFAYLNNIDAIVRYYTGNNNWLYKYGRFEAIKNVFGNVNTRTKIFGAGIGASTPLYMVFFNELGRTQIFPYYIKIYGYYYGYQHTSASTLLLDGGIVLFSIVIVFILIKLIQSMKQTSSNINNSKAFIKFGILIYLLYYFSYANVLKDFRAMAIIGLILGLNIYNEKIIEKGKKHI